MKSILLSILVCSSAAFATPATAAPQANADYAKVTNFENVKAIAAARAKEAHRPRATLPKSLEELSYEQFMEIEFKQKEAIWRNQNGPFFFETFHRGFVQRDRINLFVIEDGACRKVPFSKTMFDYTGSATIEDIPADAGHAGIKLIANINGVVDSEEMLTFLGASYFRARSVETGYGASARGLGLDLGIDGPEEFPYFTDFWIAEPTEGEQKVTLFALMDSPTVCGAYQFQFNPGAAESSIDVRAELNFRKSPQKFCVAPLTSMWMWGDGLAPPPKDKRPGVHDSDGLLIRRKQADTETDQWTWRTLSRQPYPSVSRFDAKTVSGFGLLQRNRAFYHYDDHNARYDLRPSVWVSPDASKSSAGLWSDGRVELFEMPGAHEGIDNIGAYWVPRDVPKANDVRQLAYRVSFFPGDYKEETDVARATTYSLARKGEDQMQLQVRFSGDVLSKLKDVDGLKIQCGTIRAEVLKKSLKQEETGDVLVALDFQFKEDAPAEITLALIDDEQSLSETFAYLCPRETPTFIFPAVYSRQE